MASAELGKAAVTHLRRRKNAHHRPAGHRDPEYLAVAGFYKALLGTVEISRVPEDGPAFYVGLQIGNAELGVVADGDAHIDAPQRILLNVNVSDLALGSVTGLLEHVEALGGRVLGPPNDMPWGQRVAHIQDPDGNTVNLTEPI